MKLAGPVSGEDGAGALHNVHSMEEATLTKVQKWGNSLGLRIPRSFAADARVEPGSVVDISLVRGGLMVRLARPRRYRLEDLLKGVSRRNLHEEVDLGDPVGREAW